MSKHFPVAETSCRCGCGFDAREELKAVLDAIRERVGQSLSLNCAARCAKHNADPKVGGSKKSAHVLGLAADIVCTDNLLRWKILEAIYFVREQFKLPIGVPRLEWGTKTWIHVDIAQDPVHPPGVFKP